MGTVVRLAAALLIGLMVFVVLVPTSGAGTRCFSLLSFQVPCQGAVAAVAGAAAAAIVGLGLWLAGRRHLI